MNRLITFLSVLIASASLMQCAPRISADVALLNGNIISTPGTGSRIEALAIKDGKVVSAGTNRSVRKSIAKETSVIDLDGKTVVPGFNDAHLHP